MQNSTVPAKMQAISIVKPGGPEVLQLLEHPVPQVGEEQLLVKIAAAGVNRPDILQRMGAYPPPPGAPEIPGLEIAGIVAARGAKAARFNIGDKVTALVAGGGYGEYACVHATNALPVPDGLSLSQAAALPETFFTVWHNVFQRGQLKSGEKFLVHGGSSGIGTTAIQLAKAFGAEVYATAGSAEKCNKPLFDPVHRKFRRILPVKAPAGKMRCFFFPIQVQDTSTGNAEVTHGHEQKGFQYFFRPCKCYKFHGAVIQRF